MPAVALAHAPLEEEVHAHAAQPAPAPAAGAPLQDDFEWRHVADYVDRFQGFEELEQTGIRTKPRTRRHRPFAMLTSANLAAVVVLCQLLGLVWLRAVDLQAIRQASSLDQEIGQTSESIARTQKKIAAATSKPILAQWAAQMGYRPPSVTDFDDVTKNTPPPPLYPSAGPEAAG